MKNRWRTISWACAVAIGLHASTATALSKHRLVASVGAGMGDMTLDPTDSSVEIFFENGVAGVDPSSRSLFATVDSASGVMVVNGATNNLLLPNQSRAVGLLEQLMDMSSVPTIIDVVLILNGGGVGGFVELDASLQVGNCIVGLSQDVGSANDGYAVVTNGCDDSTFVTWNAGGGPGALHITSNWVKLPPFGEVYMAAQVSGDFGGSLGDIPNGSFSHSGQLSIGVQRGNVVFFSDSFLTVPEPDGAAAAAFGAIALLTRRRAR
jgi:hypothetical protein